MATLAIERVTTETARWRFVVTIFAGSFLLFLIQPMIARMTLPRLGGSPSVWNSAMLVYQVLLLGGYAFAHWIGRFPARTQGLLQAGALMIAAVMLPLHLSGAMLPPEANAYVWVPWLLLVSIGPVFLFVSAQAPLIQRWYVLSGEGNPYPLYAASNLGSFAGLLSYPLLVEPLLTVSQQSAYWSIGYLVLLVLVGLIALKLPTQVDAVTHVPSESTPLSRATVAKWIGLAAIPSGLMLSTTLHVTTDLVAMPLLWVGPLGLYLLSFSVAFAGNRRPAQLISAAAPLFTIVVGFTVFAGASTIALAVAGFLLTALFVISVAIHSLLFELRPAPSRLTAFYLALSVGGVVGGLFCALVAPLLFDWTYEHPILMICAGWCCGNKVLLPTARTRWFKQPLTQRTELMVGAAIIGLACLATIAGLDKMNAVRAALYGLFGFIALLALGNRHLFTAALVSLMLFAGGLSKIAMSIEPGRMTRSFFGINRIDDANNVRFLVHGSTMHGVQVTGSLERERRTTSYYAPQSGVGLAMASAPVLFGPAARIDVVGLGAGTLACYARPGQAWRFYEIDPVMVDVAKTRFTFLSRCLPTVPIELGDARLSLARRPTASTDLLVIDAFSSDSVPMHLLTLEAFAMYRRTLAANGLLLVHISNRFLDLKPVLAAAARHGWYARIRNYDPTKEELALQYTASSWVALSPSPDTMAKLVASSPPESWDTFDRAAASSAWTDEYASILPFIEWSNFRR